MASKLLEQSRSLRSRYTNRFAPLEKRFIEEGRITPGERDQANSRVSSDIARLGKTDLDARIRGRLLGGNMSSSSSNRDLTANAISGARANSRAYVDTTARQDAEEDRNLGAAVGVGQNLLSGSLAATRDIQHQDEAEELSRYNFNEDRNSMFANAAGNTLGQVAGGPGGFKDYRDAFKSGGFAGLRDLYDFKNEANLEFPASNGWVPG